MFTFPPFHLDPEDGRLWRGHDTIHLTNKAFDVLCYLLQHANQLVTKSDLLEAVWPDTYASEATLAVCIRELRRALGDQARTPQYIETVRGRGYRFIALPPMPSPPQTPNKRIVGRQAEWTQLQQWYGQASRGERLIGVITGEAGIGKTALVEAFTASVEMEEPAWIGRGQCIDQYGAGEAYLPLLEALGRLCRGPEGPHVMRLLKEQAPSWIAQMPALLKPEEREPLQRTVSGTTQPRMLRELTEAIEQLTVERPLLLILEDLHWSDTATLAWLSSVARRRESARLLILGTYRPVDAILAAHPLRDLTRELDRLESYHELLLDYLPESDVRAYLAQRFAHPSPSLDNWARLIHQRTNGNALFMVSMVEAWEQQGIFTKNVPLEPGIESLGIPRTLRHLIEHQIEQISPEDREWLEAASVAGIEFSAAAVAAGIAGDAEAIETRCTHLARRGQLIQERRPSTWPDGTIAASYGFIHALHHEVLYHGVSAGRKARLHRQIGLWIESAHGAQARDAAAELAVHFERGNDAQRAVQYLLYAGENALLRSAHHEAIVHLSQGLNLLQTQPECNERTQRELALRMALGPALMATKGFGAEEVERTYQPARQLCRQVPNTPQSSRSLWGLFMFHFARGELQTTRELGEELLEIAQRRQEPMGIQEAHHSLSQVLFWLGDFAMAHQHAEQGMAVAMSREYRDMSILYKQEDPELIRQSAQSWLLWARGYPDQALTAVRDALRHAPDPPHPHSMSRALCFVAGLHYLRREPQAVQSVAETVIQLTTQQAFPLWLALGTIFHGWALTEQGQSDTGLAEIRAGITDFQATGMGTFFSCNAILLAESYAQAGQAEAGLATLDEAFARMRPDREQAYLAELYRVQGELRQQAGGPTPSSAPSPEAHFLKALDLARQQHAKSFELRAAVSLARWWQSQGKRSEAQDLLAPVYAWFTEGFDTADLRAAQALITELTTAHNRP